MKKFYIALLTILLMIPTVELGFANSESVFSADLREYLEYEEPSLVGKSDADYIELAKTITEIFDYSDKEGKNMYVFDYKGIDQFVNIERIDVPVDISGTRKVENFSISSDNTEIASLNLKLVEFTEITNSVHPELNGKKEFQEASDSVSAMTFPQKENYFKYFIQTHEALRSNYKGKTVDIVPDFEIRTFFDSFDWRLGDTDTLNYDFENEGDYNAQIVFPKKIIDEGTEMLEYTIQGEALPRSISVEQGILSYTPADHVFTTANIEDLLLNLEDFSGINETGSPLLNFTDDTLPLNKFNLIIRFIDGTEFTMNIDEWHNYFNNQTGDFDNHIGSGYGVQNNVQKLTLQFEVNQGMEDKLHDELEKKMYCLDPNSDIIADGKDFDCFFSDEETALSLASLYGDFEDDGSSVRHELDSNVDGRRYVLAYQYYNLDFIGNGGLTSDAKELDRVINLKMNDSVLSPEPITKAGYVFDGWYKDADFKNIWDFDTNRIEGNTTLYAKWVDAYTVNFETNGGTAVPSITGLKANDRLTNQETTKAGYTFKGWYTDTSLTTAWNFDTDTVQGDMTLYAKWSTTPIQTYTVNFETNGGTAVQAISGLKANDRLTNQETTKAGYTFEGWYTDTSLTTAWNFDTDTVQGDMTLYAKWSTTPIQTYTVTFETNGGTAVPSITGLKANDRLTNQETSKAGYTFEGWYTDTSLTTAWNFDTDTVQGDMTLYAKWSTAPIQTYTVTFETNGGTAVQAITGLKAKDRLTNQETTKAGYTFEGWYTDTSLTTAWNFDTDTVQGDMTLYAKWSVIPTQEPEVKPEPKPDHELEIEEKPTTPTDQQPGEKQLPATGISQPYAAYGMIAIGILILVRKKVSSIRID